MINGFSNRLGVGIRERQGLKIISRNLVWVTGSMELALTETGKYGEDWKLKFKHVILKISIRCSSGNHQIDNWTLWVQSSGEMSIL